LNNVVLITGVTGFLGCHIGELLCNNNYKVIATRRSSSNLKNCLEFQEKITWVNIDDSNWKEQIISCHPTIIVHAAWIGVTAAERDDWEQQSRNILFLQDLLQIAKESNTNKFIGLGSQAEYGFIDVIVAESHPLKPNTAYGAVKIICNQLIKNFCTKHLIQWYWLRVFSVFGEKEASNWLIPSVIRAVLAKQENKMALSPGDQQYAYLYTKDFATAILRVIKSANNNSGIYNISSTRPSRLKNILTLIRDKIDPGFKLDFGALPYRPNQSMLIAGDSSLFNAVFGSTDTTVFEEAINNTIRFYEKN
jgi:nucleoside-diphosphate-sugar epimerase